MKQITLLLMLAIGIATQAQFAGVVDTTFAPNQTTNGYYKAVGVEVVGNNVYYAYSTPPGQPVVRKYDFSGNEDQSWYANQMSTWGTQFATIGMEPERSSDGSYTGKFFVCGRNSFNSLVNQGVRFLNKVNADGTRDLNFVCPYTSWISICSAVFHDWENQKLYFAFRNGYGTVTVACCDSNTGSVFQTYTIPVVDSSFDVKKITKVPGTNDIIVGGNFSFSINNNTYAGLFKLSSDFTPAPIGGITNLPCNFFVSDILFVNDAQCDGALTGNVIAYVAGGGTMLSGKTDLRGLARFNITNNSWTIDQNYNAGCSGSIGDIAYYNCHLIAVGNFASSIPSGPYTVVMSPKITAFTSTGAVSSEFNMYTVGSGLGGVPITGFENNIGQGTGTCVAVSNASDGNGRWEIFVGGSFVSVVQAAWPRNVIKRVNYVAKLFGFGVSIDSKFTYCLSLNNDNGYGVSTFDMANTSGCEKWELFQSNDGSNWTSIRVDFSHDFSDTTLVNGIWYKLSRTVTECGNSCTSTYVIYSDAQNCQIQNNGAELRSVQVTADDRRVLELQGEESSKITTYPNPASNFITITDAFGDVYKNVDVFNSIGARVTSVTTNAKTYQVDLSNVSSGVYMIVVTTDNGVLKQSIIKE